MNVWLVQAFEKHVSKVHNSAEFKEVAKKSQPFFNSLKDFAFGRELSMENMVRSYERFQCLCDRS